MVNESLNRWKQEHFVEWARLTRKRQGLEKMLEKESKDFKSSSVKNVSMITKALRNGFWNIRIGPDFEVLRALLRISPGKSDIGSLTKPIKAWSFFCFIDPPQLFQLMNFYFPPGLSNLHRFMVLDLFDTVMWAVLFGTFAQNQLSICFFRALNQRKNFQTNPKCPIY